MIVAGFGFRTGATVESLQDALSAANAGGVIDRLATPADKAESACFRDFVAAVKLPVTPISANSMQAIETQTQSARVLLERGTGSVAEACALAAAGAEAKLITQRHISADQMATCAIAISSGGETL